MRGDAVPTHSRGDLRGQSIDRKREVESKSKWQPKWAYDGMPHVAPGPNNTERPKIALHTQGCQRGDRKTNAKPHRRSERLRKQEVGSVGTAQLRKQEVIMVEDRADVDTTDEDGSVDSTEPHAASDFEAAYYLDPEHSSPHGEEVLGIAVTQAVRKFEDKKTRELVRDEYDVLDEASDTEPDDLSKGKGSVDEDFELL
ncbi:MAG: hypothetical protein M1828_006104 [Chrysothrix sp. TS-e1954]|nr:MAG: hypothetical protein M1828_006104 [Chrysothrix sp. TS-e1954]